MISDLILVVPIPNDKEASKSLVNFTTDLAALSNTDANKLNALNFRFKLFVEIINLSLIAICLLLASITLARFVFNSPIGILAISDKDTKVSELTKELNSLPSSLSLFLLLNSSVVFFDVDAIALTN